MGEETEILEFKTSTAEIPAALNSIVAMLNKHQNGTVYFGVKNNGEPVGQQMGENTVRDVTKAITEYKIKSCNICDRRKKHIYRYARIFW